jgi:CheY-like chemotaxis protein
VTQPSFSESPKYPQRVLLVEDNLINQKIVVKTLNRVGYDCDVASDGEMAVQTVLDHDYDLVLMDCNMPIMDGFEATRVIRKNEVETGKHILIYAMTANSTDADKQACLDAGMDGVFVKPIEKDKMSLALAEIFQNQI